MNTQLEYAARVAVRNGKPRTYKTALMLRHWARHHTAEQITEILLAKWKGTKAIESLAYHALLDDLAMSTPEDPRP